MDFRVDHDLIEYVQIAERPEQLARKHAPKVDDLLCFVVKGNPKRVRPKDAEVANAVNWMSHCSLQRFDRSRRLPVLKELPVSDKLVLVQFRPGLNETKLSPRERAGKQFYRVKPNDGNIVFVVGMEVRRMMWSTSLHVHPYYNPKKSAEFWHIKRHVHKFRSSMR